MKVVEVVLPVPLNKSFYYTIPEVLQKQEIKYRRVNVDFGNRTLVGYAISIIENYQPQENIKLKDINAIIDECSILTDVIVALSKWLCETYLCSVGEALATIVPISLQVPKRISKVNILKNGIFNSNFDMTIYQKNAVEQIEKSIKIILVIIF